MRQAGRCRWVNHAEPTYLLATTRAMSPSESGWNEVEPDKLRFYVGYFISKTRLRCDGCII